MTDGRPGFGTVQSAPNGYDGGAMASRSPSLRVSISPEMKAELDRLRDERSVNVSAWVRGLIEEGLARASGTIGQALPPGLDPGDPPRKR